MQKNLGKAGVVILVSKWISSQDIRRDKAYHYILVKGTAQQEELIVTYTPNSDITNFIKQMD